MRRQIPAPSQPPSADGAVDGGGGGGGGSSTSDATGAAGSPDDGGGGGGGMSDAGADGTAAGADEAAAGDEPPLGAEAELSSSPGQILADEGSHFAALFELLTLSDERLSLQAWQLLMMLPTNRAMRSGLASLPGLPPAEGPPDWPSILPVGPSSFKLLYSLQVRS